MDKLDQIKYVAVDMDGTLLDNNLEIMPKTRQAIIDLQKNGVKLIIATGRALEGVKKYIPEIKIKEYGGLIISGNGAIVYDPVRDEIIYRDYISVEEACQILDRLKKFNIFPFYRQDGLMHMGDYKKFLEANGEKTDLIHFEDIKLRGYLFDIVEHDDLCRSINKPIMKLMAAGNPEYMWNNFHEINKELEPIAHAMLTLSTILEFSKLNVSKGHALESLGIDPNHLMAFGDSLNDFHMIKFAKYGIAMGNAMQPLKDIAFGITSSNVDEGIYEALIKYGIVKEQL